MKLILFLIFPTLICYADAGAFTIKGLVRDAVSGEPLQAVVIQNLNTGNLVYSDTAGNFYLMGKPGDMLSLRSLGYTGITKRVSADDEMNVLIADLKRQDIAIDTIVVKSFTKYQQDSLQRRAIYGNALDKKPARFGLAKADPLYGGGPQGAFTLNAPISSIIQKRTRKYKRLKAFQDRFKNEENQSYIDSRYTPQLITELTGLKEDSLVLFMKTFPIDYNFSRAVTELELKMWVKYNYRTWKPSLNATKKEE